MDWLIYAWLKRGNRRIQVLSELSNSNVPLTINDIRKKQKVALPQISFTIKELLSKKLIICLNPEDNIGKLYVATEKGSLYLKELF